MSMHILFRIKKTSTSRRLHLASLLTGPDSSMSILAWTSSSELVQRQVVAMFSHQLMLVEIRRTQQQDLRYKTLR